MNAFVNFCSWHYLEKEIQILVQTPLISTRCEQQAPEGSSRTWEVVAALLTFGSWKKQWARSAVLQMWTCLEAECAEISCWWEKPSPLQLLHYPSDPSVIAQLLRYFQPEFNHFLHSPFELWVWITFHFVLSFVVFDTRIWFPLCQLSLPFVPLSLQVFWMVTLMSLVVHPLCHKVLTQQCCPGDVQGCASKQWYMCHSKRTSLHILPKQQSSSCCSVWFWVMAHESGNNGKCGMFRLILRSRFHFPCNSFMNQKGKCVMLSVHLELYTFRALCRHFFCTSDFMMVGDGKLETTVSTTPALLSFYAVSPRGAVVKWSLLLQELLWAFQSSLELCSLWVGC